MSQQQYAMAYSKENLMEMQSKNIKKNPNYPNGYDEMSPLSSKPDLLQINNANNNNAYRKRFWTHILNILLTILYA